MSVRSGTIRGIAVHSIHRIGVNLPLVCSFKKANNYLLVKVDVQKGALRFRETLTYMCYIQIIQFMFHPFLSFGKVLDDYLVHSW